MTAQKALGAVKKAAAAPDAAPEAPSAGDEALAPAPEPVDLRPTVTQALSAVAADLPSIGKDQTHAQGFAYRGIEHIMRSAGTILQRHGVVVTPNVRHRDVEMLQVGSNKVWRLVSLEVRFRFYGPRGDYVDAVTVGEGFDPGDKAASKAHTMAYKTALIEVLQIAEGDDAEADEHPEPRRQQRPQAPQEAPVQPKPREQIIAEVREEYGAEHASGVTAVVDGLNEVEEEVRATVKAEFVEQYGNPWRLTPDQLGPASIWLATKLPGRPD